jgi:accessory gene regulator protein AgrB
MKVLTPRTHGILDYVTVIAFLLAPTLFDVSGLPVTISYLLAVVHLVLTIITAFPLGLIKAVPFRLHGMIELTVSIILVLLPWLLGFASIPAARNFYVATGIVIFIVWLITDYTSAPSTDQIDIRSIEQR